MNAEEAWQAHDDGSLSGAEHEAFLAGWTAALTALTQAEYRLVYDWPDGTQSVIDAASEGKWPPFGTTAAYLRQGWKRQRRAVTEWKDAQ